MASVNFGKTTRLFAIILALCAFGNALAGAETPPPTASWDFSRRQTKESGVDETRGTAYYRASPHLFCVSVESPVRQVIFYDARQTLIYYPDSNRAIRLDYDSDQPMVFESEFLYLLYGDKGLGSLGFTMGAVSKAGQNFSSAWKPPKKSARQIDKATTLMDGSQNVVKIEIFGKKKNVLLVSEYSDYSLASAAAPAYPRRVSTKTFYDDGSALSSVALDIGGATVGSPLPDSIANFSLPAGCALQVMQ